MAIADPALDEAGPPIIVLGELTLLPLEFELRIPKQRFAIRTYILAIQQILYMVLNQTAIGLFRDGIDKGYTYSCHLNLNMMYSLHVYTYSSEIKFILFLFLGPVCYCIYSSLLFEFSLPCNYLNLRI